RGTLCIPLEPFLLRLCSPVHPPHAVNLDADLLLILFSSRNSGVTEIAVYTTLAEVVALGLEEVLPVLNRVALIVFAKRLPVSNSLVGAGRTTRRATTG